MFPVLSHGFTHSHEGKGVGEGVLLGCTGALLNYNASCRRREKQADQPCLHLAMADVVSRLC